MAVDPADKTIQLLNHLQKLEVQERLLQAQHAQQQEVYRLARKLLTQGIRKAVGLRYK